MAVQSWEGARATGSSLYLKQLGLAGDRAIRFRTDGTLVVPVMEVVGATLELCGTVEVAANGTRSLNLDDGKACAFLALGKVRTGRMIYVAEDLTSAFAIREAIEYRILVLAPLRPADLVAAVTQLARAVVDAPIGVFSNGCPEGADEMARAARVAALQCAGALWVVQPPQEPLGDEFKGSYLAWRASVGAEAFADAIRSSMPASRTGTAAKPEASAAENSDPTFQACVPRAEAWAAGLQLTDSGRPRATVWNAHLLLNHHADWSGVLAFDDFAGSVVKVKAPPYEGGAPGEWTELDDARLLLWLSPRIGELSPDAIARAVTLAAHQRTINPLRDFLEACAALWDGRPRLSTWLSDYLGAGAEARRLLAHAQAGKGAIRTKAAEQLLDYLDRCGTKWLIGAVARTFEPGCRVDNMLILEGEQGARKSTALSVLGGEWFTDAALDFSNRDSLLILQGRWIIEMAELEGMNKAETSQTKKFLTQHTDLFRPPYGRKLVKRPRRCVFAGSVNLDQYLKDDSGNRRFWPVRVGEMNIEALKRDARLLWGEAVHRYRERVPWWVLPEDRALFAEQQDERFTTDPWQSAVMDYLDGERAFLAAGRRDSATIHEILGTALKLDKARWDRQAATRIAGIFRHLKWTRRRDSGPPPRAWYYLRPGAAPRASRHELEEAADALA